MRYLVIGAGVSGLGACDLLAKLKEDVTLYDKNKKKLLSISNSGLVDEKVQICFKDINKQIKANDCIVLSPGVVLNKKTNNIIKKQQKTLIGEIELGAMHTKARVIAITGTNGKTTTTSLINHILCTANKRAYAVGNIGKSVSSVALEAEKTDILVCEVSSFQLQNTVCFHPHISAFLNFAPDHLDVHSNMHEYLNAKKKIFTNQTSRDYAILNYDDAVVRNCDKDVKAKIIYISQKDCLNTMHYAAWVQNNVMHIKFGEIMHTIDLCDIINIKLHNLYNIMVACVVALLNKIDNKTIIQSLNSFVLPQHRCQLVCQINGIKFVDDSKATNIHATLFALQSLCAPLILLLGGSDKKENFENFIAQLPHNVKKVVCFGQKGKSIYKLCNKYKIPSCYFKKFCVAVKQAKSCAKSGDMVLLSPACASFDQFNNYAERGDLFKYLVCGDCFEKSIKNI